MTDPHVTNVKFSSADTTLEIDRTTTNIRLSASLRKLEIVLEQIESLRIERYI
jgi:hypothetical protein